MKNCFNRISRRADYRETGISVDSVRQRVAQKLGDAPEEQERTRQRMKKRLVLSVVVAILLFATAAAATSYHLGILIPGNLGIIQSNIQTKPISGKLGEFEVTVLESVSDESSIFMTVSIKGLTEKAIQLVKDERACREILDVYVDGSLEKEREMIIFNDFVTELCTADTICMVGDFNCPNPERKPLIVQIEPYFLKDNYPGVTVTETLTIPTDNQVSGSFTIAPKQDVTVSKLINGGKQITINRVILSQFAVRVDFTVHNRYCNPDEALFLQMADGSIRTYNDTFTVHGGGGGGTNDDYTDYGKFRELTDLKTIKAFVIDTTAYPLDGGKPYQVEIDPHLRSFQITSRQKFTTETNVLGETYERPHDWYPVKELCEKLGAQYAWDAAKKTVSITYRGKNLTLPLGKTTVSHSYFKTLEIETELAPDGTLLANRELLLAFNLGMSSITPNSASRVIYP